MDHLKNKSYVVFDIEILNEVDTFKQSWSDAPKFGIAVCCTYSSRTGEFRDWIEGVHSMFELWNFLNSHDLIVSYNGINFDYKVLGGSLIGGYNPKAPMMLEMMFKGKTVDLCLDFHKSIGARVKLESVANPTLGESKSMDGALAPAAFRGGKCLEVIGYCRNDVDLTKKLFERIINDEELSVKNKTGNVTKFKYSVAIR